MLCLVLFFYNTNLHMDIELDENLLLGGGGEVS